MEDNRPSRTAQGAALHRAAHQLLDNPPVFADPLALKIIGDEAERELRNSQNDLYPEGRVGLRAFIAARSRFSEDTLAEAVKSGVRQYVLLGAGLDTFAYRAAKMFPGLSIFEVDHPATQGWKRQRLAEAGIAVPDALTYAPLNFETETLAHGRARAGFDTNAPAVFAWLGVVPYLTQDAIMATFCNDSASSRERDSTASWPYSSFTLARKAASGVGNCAGIQLVARDGPVRSRGGVCATAKA